AWGRKTHRVASGKPHRVRWLGKKRTRPGSWLAGMLERKPRLLVAIALANKIARAISAMLVRGEHHRDPAANARA
ncbi:MAG: hypothetical protein AAFW98_17990, partial [Pseudomonadota bacterium]